MIISKIFTIFAGIEINFYGNCMRPQAPTPSTTPRPRLMRSTIPFLRFG